MELRQLISKFTYRIEPKPGVGFIAYPSDPTATPLEAPTRAELQQKIQAAVMAGLGAQFPGLKSALEGQPSNFAFHIEAKPGGGFLVHSADPHAEPIEIASHHDMESHFAQKVINFVGKHVTPELAQAIAQGGSGEVQVSVNRKVGLTVKTGTRSFTLGSPSAAPTEAGVQNPPLIDGQIESGTLDGNSNTVSSSPITPEPSSNWTMFLFILLVAALAAIVILLRYR